ncbi:viral DNA cleavage/packaging protein [Suid gammaherpesvirus 3]|uniref:Viral DNA cleavage/packaging protein n=1 Tax=Suid gammaherpesvirus 3 TaxID=1960249 RepID=Q8JYC5_9GAMA|nr:viral DNA cleavage/packaging protein [Porcine lymphotropic herpesvirus 1]AAM22130.1 viral DNA cleavage/packaging protein [Porcine lymphotropic herpesvirus 1]
MDVHINNWRYKRAYCDLIIHTVIPEAIFSPYEWTSNSNVFQVKFQTVFYQTQAASRWVKMWARRLNDEHRIGTLSKGVSTSFPIFLEDNIWHPFNILILKINNPDGDSTFIKFFYLTIVSGYLHASRSPDLSMEVQTQSHKEDVFHDILTATRETSFRYDPKSMLNNLLEINETCRPMYHQALENSVDLRGRMIKVKERNKDHCKNANIVTNLPTLIFSNVFTEESLVSITVLHCFTRNRIWICAYEKCKQTLVSYLDMLSENDLNTIDPLLIVKAEADYFYRLVRSFIASVERECEHVGYNLTQNIPLFIEKSSHVLNDISAHFYEACVTITSLYNENSGLIKAALARFSHQEGYWLDVIGLWECRRSHWGIRLNLKPEKTAAKDINIESIICRIMGHEDLVESLTTCAGFVGLLYTSSLVSWLIIPGGFAIKGYFDLSDRDMQYLVDRYGS